MELRLSISTLTAVALIIINVFVSSILPEKEVVFEFKEFDHVESPKNEIAFAEWSAACEQTPACLGLSHLNKTRCVRKCISPSCYAELYAFDELEEGEIDVRFATFKGCFVQRSGRKRI